MKFLFEQTELVMNLNMMFSQTDTQLQGILHLDS